jgi:hypothetical protein
MVLKGGEASGGRQAAISARGFARVTSTANQSVIAATPLFVEIAH